MIAVKIYTVANLDNVCAGHGDYYDAAHICRQGSYESGEFPPCFVSKAGAEAYLETTKAKAFSKRLVVELILLLPEQKNLP